MTVLILVDLQNDFMPGGALGVPKGNEIIPQINQLMKKFKTVVATQDWHPSDHMSFDVSHPGKKVGDVVEVQGIPQILWPVHCVRNTFGAELTRDLNIEAIESIFYKGTDKLIDSYSAFFDNSRLRSTGLDEFLITRGIKKIYIAGLATDYCVLYSALDAISLGFFVYVVEDCCRGINLHPDDEKKAFAKMKQRGVHLVSSERISIEDKNPS